jgi:hypothetical protein
MEPPTKKRKVSSAEEKLCCSLSELMDYFGSSSEGYREDLAEAGIEAETVFPDEKHSEPGDLKVLHMNMQDGRFGVARIPKRILCAGLLAFLEAGRASAIQVWDSGLLKMRAQGALEEALGEQLGVSGDEPPMSKDEAVAFTLAFTYLCTRIIDKEVTDETDFLVRFIGPIC